jgi:hypothetical protein
MPNVALLIALRSQSGWIPILVQTRIPREVKLTKEEMLRRKKRLWKCGKHFHNSFALVI